MILGQMTGVGVGPGDPELITLKAIKVIQRSDIVAYPAPDSGSSFARDIIKNVVSLNKTQREYQITIPMRVARFPAAEIYDHAAAELGAEMDKGKNISVLCEGDPFFYGSYMYLHERLSKRYRMNVIPGISSVMAMAAVAERPLCERNEILTIIPGPLEKELMRQRLQIGDPCVIMKVGRHFQKIRDCLIETNRAKNAVYIERASLPNQKILPITAVDSETAPYFSIIHVGSRKNP